MSREAGQSANHRQTNVTRRFWTIPNILCLFRLGGAVGLVALAVLERADLVLALFFLMMVTDWIDGKLAVWLDQRSELGPRLDSWADAAMYGGVLLAGVWLKAEALRAEWPWIAAVVLTYFTSCAAAILKFRRYPSYHTRSAKTGWLLMAIAVAALFLNNTIWPLRVALAGVTLANVEALVITWRLKAWKSNVISFLHLPKADPPE